ncbi:hypothetical protein ACQP0C_12830 [Nocardia sp. CA-129566]|uniref:hypothetical protein n=1 Tax=Nocardia sp. CA-129566 TaxID=3239976 RepID=UPI003D97498B
MQWIVDFSAAVVLGLIAVLALVPVTRADQVRAIDQLGTVTAALGCGALAFGLIDQHMVIGVLVSIRLRSRE